MTSQRRTPQLDDAMYEAYFGLQCPPFQLTPDPRFLYLSASHKEAYAQLLLGLRMRRGFIVLTGEVGTGKTTLLRAVMRDLDSNIHPALIFHTLLSAKGLLQNICKEFGIDTAGLTSKSELIICLHEFLEHLQQRGCSAVLIIDEAHNLREEVLEEIRLLSNFETAESKLLQICLVGQPELSQTLTKPALRQLNQRISLRFQLHNLSEAETRAYIKHRLAVAGLRIVGELFTDAAIHAIYAATGGVPRTTNILCENALVMGFVKAVTQIDRDIIQAVAHEDTFQEIQNALEQTEPMIRPEAAENTMRRPQQNGNSMKSRHENPGGGSPFVNRGGWHNGNEPHSDDSNGKLNAGFRQNESSTARPPGHIDGMFRPYREISQTEGRVPDDLSDGHDTNNRSLAAKNSPRSTDPVLREVTESVLRRTLQYYKDYVLIKRPKFSTLFAIFVIGFLTYVIAILSTVLLLQRFGAF